MRRPSIIPQRPRRGIPLTPVNLMLFCAAALTMLGLIILFSASTALRQGPYGYLAKQIVGVLLASGACIFISRLDLEEGRRYVWFIGGIAILGLILVAIPGVGISVNGSRRWLGVGPLRLQVSEIAKLAMVYCLAHYLAINQTRIGELLRGFLLPLGIIVAFGGLVMLQPDFGTAALTVAVGLILLFFAGASWRYILPAIGLILTLFVLAVIDNPNRLQRFLAFLDVEANKQVGTYQLWQALLAFAAGGVEGAGLGQGRQQHKFLPEAHTDFIFAVGAEELGIGFTIGVVCLFAFMFVLGLLQLRRAPNSFQFLLVAGCLLLITLQAIINLGVVTGIFPTKGMSLPFLSAGLSNLLLMGMILGVFLNTQRNWGRAALSPLDAYIGGSRK